MVDTISAPIRASQRFLTALTRHQEITCQIMELEQVLHHPKMQNYEDNEAIKKEIAELKAELLK